MNQRFRKSVEEVQLGVFGYADENDLRKYGWLNYQENESASNYKANPGFAMDIQQLEMQPFYTDVESSSVEIAVNLEDRHLAIESLMKIYNQQSRAYGAQHSGFDNLVEHHGIYEADRIAHGMMRKSEIASRDIDKHVRILIADKALKQAGFDDEYINNQIEYYKKSLNSYFGPTHSNAKDREKFAKSTRPLCNKPNHWT